MPTQGPPMQSISKHFMLNKLKIASQRRFKGANRRAKAKRAQRSEQGRLATWLLVACRPSPGG